MRRHMACVRAPPTHMQPFRMCARACACAVCVARPRLTHQTASRPADLRRIYPHTQDKEAKVAYLTKLIAVLSLALGEDVPAKPAKVPAPAARCPAAPVCAAPRAFPQVARQSTG